MIFHIGKKIEFGHYMYYSRIDRGRWAEMNDRVVREFQLDEEEQPFELQMKAEKTPYILVYKLGTGRW